MASKFEFHCHSKFSSCSNFETEDIIKKCEKLGIDGIALTDHNTIEGAIELKNNAPDWLGVVIGEEILTVSGEIIGLFLNKKIPPGLSVIDTISEIKKQGGLAILPHPFDRLRSKFTLEEIEKHINYFDIIEIFNGRTIFSSDNKKAEEYAKNKNKPVICGSDAHFMGEYGGTIINNISQEGPQEFLESLKNATFSKFRRASFIFHLIGKLRKLIRKLK